MKKDMIALLLTFVLLLSCLSGCGTQNAAGPSERSTSADDSTQGGSETDADIPSSEITESNLESFRVSDTFRIVKDGETVAYLEVTSDTMLRIFQPDGSIEEYPYACTDTDGVYVVTNSDGTTMTFRVLRSNGTLFIESNGDTGTLETISPAELPVTRDTAVMLEIPGAYMMFDDYVRGYLYFSQEGLVRMYNADWSGGHDCNYTYDALSMQYSIDVGPQQSLIFTVSGHDGMMIMNLSGDLGDSMLLFTVDLDDLPDTSAGEITLLQTDDYVGNQFVDVTLYGIVPIEWKNLIENYPTAVGFTEDFEGTTTIKDAFDIFFYGHGATEDVSSTDDLPQFASDNLAAFFSGDYTAIEEVIDGQGMTWYTLTADDGNRGVLVGCVYLNGIVLRVRAANLDPDFEQRQIFIQKSQEVIRTLRIEM